MHARKGARENYLPIQSSLCKGSKAVDVVTALLTLHPFESLYIADLDAIQNKGNNINIIKQLNRIFPQLTFWVDTGIANAGGYFALRSRNLGITVLGTETLRESALLDVINTAQHTAALSLDFHAGEFRGPDNLLHNPLQWPEHVIAMTLSRVGSDIGPDFAQLADIIQLANFTTPAKKIYAAGGVRHLADLQQLREMGAAGALVASALHDGRITASELKTFAA